jgi:hypothetical protein
MTEQEWLECESAQEMLRHLYGWTRYERKLNLFAGACCRHVWHLLTDPRSREAVEVAEQHADGLATNDELEWAGHDALLAKERIEDTRRLKRDVDAADAVLMAFESDGYMRADWAMLHAQFAMQANTEEQEATWDFQRRLILDIFNLLPFRPTSIESAWKTPTVLSLAQAAYEDRMLPAGTLEPARLAVLADALEEAGCTNADILNHCRQPGDHVRGCWMVDLLLGKE